VNTVMQEINLYQPVSKGVRGALSAGSTRTTLIAVGVALLGLWGFADWQVDHLRTATQVVRNQLAAQQAMSAAQGPELQGLGDDEINALVTRLESQIKAKTRAVALLSGESAAKGHGFAARLRAFGERHVDGVWLDHLTFGADVSSVNISGSTTSPDSVPRYLRSLAADPALQGGQIDEFIIEKPVKGVKSSAGSLTFKAGHHGLVSRQASDDGEKT
jgi:Tfp pilus assembly protein PilN